MLVPAAEALQQGEEPLDTRPDPVMPHPLPVLCSRQQQPVSFLPLALNASLTNNSGRTLWQVATSSSCRGGCCTTETGIMHPLHHGCVLQIFGRAGRRATRYVFHDLLSVLPLSSHSSTALHHLTCRLGTGTAARVLSIMSDRFCKAARPQLQAALPRSQERLIERSDLQHWP